MSDDKRSIADVIADNGFVVISTSGISMMPMLRDRRDTVEIRRCDGIPKKYDVVLFRRRGELVLHRIIGVQGDEYIIRGDNCVEKDRAVRDDIIGVLYSFTRDGKHHTVNDASYIIYSRLVVFFYPIKRLFQRIKGKIVRFVKRMR